MDTSMTLVGIYSPYPRSGKSTFAKYLAELVYPSKVIKFSEAMGNVVLPLVGHFLPGGEEEAYQWYHSDRKDTERIPGLNVTIRHMLQTCGTDWGRECIHPDMWVKVVQERIRKLRDAKQLVVVDDVRFENEYHMLLKEGAYLIKVTRDANPETVAHISNARLEKQPFDFHVVNDTTLEQLKLRAFTVGERMVIVD